MNYLLGIDVGTRCIAAGIARLRAGRVEPEVVTLGDRADAVPSVVYLASDGTVVIGEQAEQRAIDDPHRVVREPTRRIGDPTPLVVGDDTYAAEELTARIVRWVHDRVVEREGSPPVRVAVTHPASWGVHKRDLLGAALTRHGVAATLVTEPQAAATYYAATEQVAPGSTVAVYDLGGSTFTAAVVRGNGRGFQLVGRPEVVELGGDDFDEAVFEHVRSGMPEAFEGLDESDPEVWAAMARLRRECTQAKEALSTDSEVTIPVQLPGVQGSRRLRREELEAMIRPHLEQTVTALQRAVSSANLAPEQLAAVVLAGGSSRIPLVARLVSEQLGRPVTVDSAPQHVTARGAALTVAPAVAAPGPTVAMPTPRPRPTPSAAPSATGRYGAAPPAAAEPTQPTRTPPPPQRPHPPAPTIAPSVPTGPRPALLVGAGGLLAAAAVVLMLLLAPGREVEDITTGLANTLPTAPASVPETAPSTTRAPSNDDWPVVRRPPVVRVPPTPTTTPEPTPAPTTEPPTTSPLPEPTPTTKPPTTETTPAVNDGHGVEAP